MNSAQDVNATQSDADELDNDALGEKSKGTVQENIARLFACVGLDPPPQADPVAYAEYLRDRAVTTLKTFQENAAEDGSWSWIPDNEPPEEWFGRLSDDKLLSRIFIFRREFISREEARLQSEGLRKSIQSMEAAYAEAKRLLDEPVDEVEEEDSPEVDFARTAAGVDTAFREPTVKPAHEGDAEGELRATLRRQKAQVAAEETLKKANLELEKEWNAFIEKLLRRVYFSFKYKQKASDGRAIHLAVMNSKLSQGAGQLLNRLLKLKANIAEPCQQLAFNKRACVYPIHLAAGCGNASILKVLIEHRADVDLKTRVNESKKTKEIVSSVSDVGPRLLNGAFQAGAMQEYESELTDDDSHERVHDELQAMPNLEAPEAEHYTALHECAFFKRVKPVEVLIKAKADVNAKNREGSSVLHIAAKQGAWQVADLLVKSKADLRATDKGSNGFRGKTPLHRAVEHGNFPMRKLFMLAKRSVEDILLVASMSPPAAAELMIDADDAKDSGTTVHPSWRLGLVKEAKEVCLEERTVDKWCKLMSIAPQAAEYFLEALTVSPEVQDKNYHPLPAQANLRASEIVRSKYVLSMGLPQWSCYDESSQASRKGPPEPPKWHTHATKGLAPKVGSRPALAPGSPPPTSGFSHAQDRRRCCAWVARTLAAFKDWVVEGVLDRFDGPRDTVRVDIKVVMIRDLMCQEVFYVLKSTSHLHIFTKVAVRAIIQTAWHQTVSHFYYSHVFYRLVEILTLLGWVLWPPADDNEHFMTVRMTWSFLFAGACREAFYEILEIRGFFWLIVDLNVGTGHGKVMRFLENWMTLGNVCDLSAVGALFVMCCLAFRDEAKLDDHKELLAGVVLSRWVQLLISCRAFSSVGQKLLPIFQSTRAMGGIFCVTAFCFLGFLHAFWALAGEAMSVRGIFVDAVRFLLVGDGDGLDMVLGLGSSDGEPTIVAILMLLGALFSFCIWIMNLFIAGTDQAYEQALEYAHARFLQERASICLLCMFRPSLDWAHRFNIPSIAVRMVQAVIVFPVWVWLSGMPSVPTWSLALLLFLAMVLGEALLMDHPWKGHREFAAFAQAAKGAVYVAQCAQLSVARDSDHGGSSRRGRPQALRGVEVSESTRLPGSFVSPSGADLLSRDTLGSRLGDAEPSSSSWSEDSRRKRSPSEAAVPLPKISSYRSGLTSTPEAFSSSPQPPGGPHPPQDILRQPPLQPPPQMSATQSTPVTTARSDGGRAKGVGGMYLWICHREDYDEMDYWPSNAPAAEKIEGRVSALKRDGMYRSRKTLAEVASVKRRTDRLFDWVHEEVRVARNEIKQVELSARKDIQQVEVKMIKRLDEIKQLLSQIALNSGAAAGFRPADGGGSGSGSYPRPVHYGEAEVLRFDTMNTELAGRARVGIGGQALIPPSPAEAPIRPSPAESDVPLSGRLLSSSFFAHGRR